MMQRKVNFAPGEYYHVFTRGVEKRKIFLDESDFARFLALLYILNQKNSFNMFNFLDKSKTYSDIYIEKREGELVSILAYSLMPNHFHLLVREHSEGGISKFMGKLLTAYSMYFNKKNERSGPLFTRPFRAVHVARDEHLKHLFSYIHLNCVDLIEKDWKMLGIQDMKKVEICVLDYPYSSYNEFLNADTKKIVNQRLIDELVVRTPLVIQEFDEWYTLFGDENAKLEK